MMRSQRYEEAGRSGADGRWQTVVLSLVIITGLGGAAIISRRMETHRLSPVADPAEEQLYMTGTAVKRMSLSFNGLVADWYWMRSLQYVGRKIVASGGDISTDLRTLDLHLLAPLLERAVTLDPQFLAVYEYAAVVLPAVSEGGSEEAVALLKKGIAANPSAWRLYHHLGYIYWQRGEYAMAGTTYGEGARIAGAPNWMQAMSARMAVEGGSRQTAREMYRRIFEQADDQQTKGMAALRLMQLDSLDERDAIRRVLDAHRARTGRCASHWREVAAELTRTGLRVEASTGAPLDPSNASYRLVQEGCDVDLDLRASKIPYK